MILATRGSRLALAQTEIVKGKLEKLGESVELLIVNTKGDKDRKSELTKIGGDGLFIRELEKAVLEGYADAAIHSAKDLPYELMAGLMIASVPDEADPRDVIVTRKGELHKLGIDKSGFVKLSIGHKLVIGTGSPRRKAELLKLLNHKGSINGNAYSADEHFEIRNIRGNVDTRLKKLREGEYDAIVLAKAGLDRLGYGLLDGYLSEEFDFYILDTMQFIPSPCQGLLAAECRESDERTRSLLEAINDDHAMLRFKTERAVFGKLKADCSVPVGIYAEIPAASSAFKMHAAASEIEANINKADSEAAKKTDIFLMINGKKRKISKDDIEDISDKINL